MKYDRKYLRVDSLPSGKLFFLELSTPSVGKTLGVYKSRSAALRSAKRHSL